MKILSTSIYRRRRILCGLFIINILLLSAQNTPVRTISGTVSSAEGQRLSDVLVLLTDSTSSGSSEYAAITETDSLGTFQAQITVPANRIIVSRLGTDPVQVVLTPGKDRYDIVLSASSSVVLDEVKIRGHKQAVKMKIYGLEYDMKYTPVQYGNTWDALRFIPNLVVSDQNLKIIGMDQVAYYINGRKLRMQGEGALAYIRSLPTDRVERIEIITAPDGRFKESLTTGIINIITKPNEYDGLKGNANARLWKTHHVKGYGDVLLTYNKGKTNLDFFANVERNSTWFENEQETDYLQSGARTTGQETLDSQYWRTNLQATLNRQLDANSWLSATATYLYADQDIDRYGTTRYFETAGADPQAEIASDFRTTSKNHQTSANLEYTNTFGKQGTRLHATADYFYVSGDDVVQNRMDSLLSGGLSRPHSYFDEYRPQEFQLTSAGVDFTTPVGSKASLTAYTTGYYTVLDNDDRYMDYRNGAFVENALRSNYQTTREWGAEGGIQLMYRISKRWNSQIGASVQYRNYHAEQRQTGESFGKDYWQPVPFLTLVYNGNNHAFNYTGTYYAQNPSFSKMIPFRVYQSSTTYRVGNPELTQEKRTNHRFSYRFLQRYSVNVGYTYVSDQVENYSRPVGDNLIEIRPENISQNHQLDLTLNAANLPYARGRGNVNLAVGYNRMWINAQPEQGTDTHRQIDMYWGSINNYFLLSKKYQLQLICQASCYSPYKTAYTSSTTSFNFNAELQKNHKNWFFSLYGSLNPTFHDSRFYLFNNLRTYTTDQLNTRTYTHGENAVVGLKVSYSFGNQKVKKIRKGNSSSRLVKSRLE